MVTESERERFAHLLRKNPASKALDQSFREKAVEVLRHQGMSAIGLLLSKPLVSIVELARHLNFGVNAVGLEMALIEEAEGAECLRDVAKELIVRHIRESLPGGLKHADPTALFVPLAFWKQGLKRQINDESVHLSAGKVTHHLAHHADLPDGWLPASLDDTYIRMAFDQGWPANDTTLPK